MKIDLDALFAAAPSPYVLLNRDLRMVWANDAYLEATGRARDALIGRLLTEAFPAPADSVSDQMLRSSFRRVLASGKVDHLPLIPYPIEMADGSVEERYWSATHTPILDAGGAVEFILQNTFDVTQLYRSEQAGGADSIAQRAGLMQRAEAVASQNLALGAMTEFFQSAFDQAPSFMAVLNGPDHVFQIVNQSYTDLIGGREVIGQPVRAALPDIAGQGFLELLDQVYTSGAPVSFKAMPARIQPTPEARPEQHFVDFIFHPIKDDAGSPIGIFVQGHDVTGQKVAETTLTATREKFRTMAQTMPNQVWTADRDGAVNWLNDRTYEFTGCRVGDLYGENWSRVLHPEDREGSIAKWSASIRQGVAYENEFRIRSRDGSYRWHLVRASPLRADDGTLTGWVGTNTDIEDRKSTESEIAKLNATLESRVAARNRELEELHATLRQRQKMEAIGGLAGGIAHDFNNLLQVVTGNLELVAREIEAGSPARARLDQAMKSVMRGATLASQLLSFARKQPLAPKIVDLRRLVIDTTDMLSSAIGEGVELQTSFADGLWNTSVDPNNMENALLNLAINARDAMEGQGRLTIAVENADLSDGDTPPDVAPGKYVVLAVTDTGCGLAPEVAEKIFEPFFTTKQDGMGTGLGLSMVYGFAKQSGGHVAIDSTPGAGTTIRIFLPGTTQAEEVAAPVAGEGVLGGTETILLVEDDAEVRRTAFNMLTDMGYGVIEATDADHALALCEDGPRIDLLFTDVVMPGKLNGHDLAERMRLKDPDLPVLFTSGYVQDSIVHDGRLDDGVQLLGKPYSRSQLAQKIREVLGSEGVPSRPPAPSPRPVAGQDDSAGDSPLSGLRVLYCEDDVLIRMDIAEGLRHAGCHVSEAGKAGEALDMLGSLPVDILITDVGLPDRSGEDLARDARRTAPDLPVIFATGGTDVVAADALGNCRVLSKPFLESDLTSAIQSLVCPQ